MEMTPKNARNVQNAVLLMEAGIFYGARGAKKA